jgi:hypothetical protein
MLFCIEGFYPEIVPQILDALKGELESRGFNTRIIRFPSEGPFGHQLRISESGRFAYQPIPELLLRMVDRMDAFLNPVNGLMQSLDKLDCLILSESHYKEASSIHDEELRQWVIDINKNVPPVKAIFWLVNEIDTPPNTKSFPSTHLIFIDTPPVVAQQLAELIISEVNNG